MVVDSRVRVSTRLWQLPCWGCGAMVALMELLPICMWWKGILGALCEALFGARLLTDTSLFS